MKDYGLILLTGFFILGFAFATGIGLGRTIERSKLQQQAIENNCAYYSPKTGEFTWGSVK